MRILDRPFVRFLALGSVLFAAGRLFVSAEVENEGPPASSLGDEEVLFREALRLGLDRSDPVVRDRLLANLRFTGADPGASDEALLREAGELGMVQDDVVVRRRLVQAMELRLEAAARGHAPSDGELAAFVAENPGRFGRPARWRFAHVLSSIERHATDTRAVAERLRSSLVASGTGPEGASSRGDPFLLGNRYGPASEGQIASAFGKELAHGIAATEPGRWSEPLPSPYGWHVVWVEERLPARPPELAEVREAARLGLLAERERQALREGVTRFRSRFSATELRP